MMLLPLLIVVCCFYSEHTANQNKGKRSLLTYVTTCTLKKDKI